MSNMKRIESIVQFTPKGLPCREVYEFNPEGEYLRSHIEMLSTEELAFYQKETPNRHLVRHIWRDPPFREGNPSALEFIQPLTQPKSNYPPGPRRNVFVYG